MIIFFISFFLKIQMNLFKYCNNIILFNYIFFYLIIGLPIPLSSVIISYLENSNCLKTSLLSKFDLLDWLNYSGMQGVIFIFINLISPAFPKNRLSIQTIAYNLNAIFAFLGIISGIILVNNNFNCPEEKVINIASFIQLAYSIIWTIISALNLVYLLDYGEL